MEGLGPPPGQQEQQQASKQAEGGAWRQWHYGIIPIQGMATITIMLGLGWASAPAAGPPALPPSTQVPTAHCWEDLALHLSFMSHELITKWRASGRGLRWPYAVPTLPHACKGCRQWGWGGVRMRIIIGMAGFFLSPYYQQPACVTALSMRMQASAHTQSLRPCALLCYLASSLWGASFVAVDLPLPRWRTTNAAVACGRCVCAAAHPAVIRP